MQMIQQRILSLTFRLPNIGCWSYWSTEKVIYLKNGFWDEQWSQCCHDFHSRLIFLWEMNSDTVQGGRGC